MKNITKIFAIALVALGFSATSFAQTTENTTAGAKILTALTITETASLHFGTMTRPSTDATVLLTPGGSVSVATGTITLLSQAPTAQAAAYNVTGDASASYHINLPSGSITLSSGSDNMFANAFTSSKGASNNGTIGASPATDNFTVGATLNLTDAQPAGSYSGTFDVSVIYN